MGVVAAYGIVLLAACGLARGIGDAWWPGLLLLISPRWAFFAPLVPLAIWAAVARQPRVVAMVAAEAVLVAWPLMGLHLPFGGGGGETSESATVRVMTLNRGSVPIDVPRFARYLDRHRIDLVCFQDFRDDPALDAWLAEAGWHRDSSRTIASRRPIVAELPRSTQENRDQGRYTVTIFRARVATPDGREFVVGSVHMPTLRPGVNRLWSGDLAGFLLHIDWWRSEFDRAVGFLASTGPTPLIVGGDFNMPIEAGGLANLSANGHLVSAFEEAGVGWGYTRPAALPWIGIDHILVSPEWSVRRCWVGPSFGSDHKSLVAEVVLNPARP